MQPQPRSGPLPLLCALGRHKTDLLVRWNDGYYFTRCRRCGLDLVRTAFSGWTAPKRYRVVWQAEPPSASGEVQLVPADPAASVAAAEDASSPQASAPPAQERGPVEFPIRDAVEPPPGLSMTEEAFATRPVEDEARVEHAAPLQGRKDGVVVLPIEDVLQSLRPEPEAPEETSRTPSPEVSAPAADRDPPEDLRDEPVAEPPPPPPPPPRPRSRYPVIPDFMDEEFPGITWDPSTGEMIPGAQSEAREAPREAKPGWRDAIREKAQAATASGFDFIRARPSEEEAAPDGTADPLPPQSAATPRSAAPPRSFLERQGGLVAATIFGAFVLAAAIVDARSGGPARIAYRPELRSADAQVLPRSAARASERRTASVAARPSTGGDEAFVTASLLNCRAVPTNDGETVRRLSRGDAVKVLGADPGWVSVSHQGRQCWASSQWISTVKPL